MMVTHNNGSSSYKYSRFEGPNSAVDQKGPLDAQHKINSYLRNAQVEAKLQTLGNLIQVVWLIVCTYVMPYSVKV